MAPRTADSHTLMRDALLSELDVEVPDPLCKGKKVKRLTLVARALDRAIKKQTARGTTALVYNRKK